ncbi:conserved hypothetical protein [Yersinia pseudotuberculosis]|nr:conserved hypothetical protein [Yersinia pseudotuberculosis]
MDDYGADDMRCGDLSETELKTNFNMRDVSTKANPYTLTKITAFKQLQYMHYSVDEKIEKVTRQECVRILFDEFRSLSQSFSIYGPYKHLIEKMITHMQNGNGAPFRNMSLDSALKEQIFGDKSNKSSLLKIKEIIERGIDWDKNIFPENLMPSFGDMQKTILPKFDRSQDRFNGLGITVHDTYATHITIESLHIEKDSYRAIVHYNVQDHFGLDNQDIMKYRNLRFFRLWFVLQRYNQFGYKPFMTDMKATVEIKGRK